MAKLTNGNDGVYYNGKSYPPQIYNQVETELSNNILASSREVAKLYKVGKSFVCEVRNAILNGEPVAPGQKGGDHRSRFKEPELDYLLNLYNQDNATYLEEYRDELVPIYALQPPPALSTIARTLNHRLHLPRKQLTWIKREKFTDTNMANYANFCEVMATVDPDDIKSFDESHVDKYGMFLMGLLHSALC